MNTIEMRHWLLPMVTLSVFYMVGSSIFHFHDPQHIPNHLKHILHVPLVSCNLLSITKLIHDNNIVVEISNDGYVFKDKYLEAVLVKGSSGG